MNFLKRHKKLFVTGITTICLLTAVVTLNEKYKPAIINNALGFVITPIQSLCTNVGNWFSDKVDFIIRMGEMESENRSLKQQVEELSAENSRLNLVDQENQKLSELLDMERKYSNYPMVGASVIAKDMGSWYDTFIIDKGTRDGLTKDMVVLASGGLVGRIHEAGYNYSKVRSIIDDTSSVSAKSARTNDIGYLRGDAYLMLEGECRMDFIDAQAEMLEGDEIVTSHLSEIYPPGLIIGNVLEIKHDSIGTKYAIVKPFVDFKHLETVLVITQVFESDYIDNPAPASSPSQNPLASPVPASNE